MAKQTQEDIEKNHQVRRYDGIAFSLGDIKIPGNTHVVAFEYFFNYNEGTLYIIDKTGQTEGKVIKFSVEGLLKFEEVYKKALEDKLVLEAKVNGKKQ